MKTLSAPATRPKAARGVRKTEPMRDKIARFTTEFMLKADDAGFDSVGELIKSRRAS
jgi:hypothetical protein